MARKAMEQSDGYQLSDRLSMSLLAEHIPVTAIEASLREHDRMERRRRDLPSVVVMYYVLAMGLYMHVNQREVLRCIVECMQWLRLDEGEQVRIAGKSGISQARKRIGSEPVQTLYHRAVTPIASKAEAESWYRGYRKVSLDGTTLDVADEHENREAFGLPGQSRGQSAFPQVRLVGLVEVGTHVLFGVAHGAYLTGEVTLAKEVLRTLKPEMLCIADRGFYSYDLWHQATSTGAQLLWRVKSSLILEEETLLEDDSYISTLYPSPKARRHQQDGIKVRVIRYTLDHQAEEYRLITTLLDETEAPADELARLYHERWEFETVLDELKTHLRGRQIILRSKRPDLVIQEVYGLLITHFVLRSVMYQAALKNARSPHSFSFVHTINVLRRKLPSSLTLSPSAKA